MQKTGILGGTFDPVHCGHLMMARLVQEALGLDRVLCIPSGNPPHKRHRTVTPGELRMHMLQEALRGEAGLETCSLEVDRPGLTFTVDTLTELHAQGCWGDLYFMIGADVVFDLHTWRRADQALRLAKFAAVMRPGFDREAFDARVIWLKKNYGAEIYPVTMPQVEISATLVRKRAAAGLPLYPFVPKAVETIIRERQLYPEEEG